MQTLDRRAFFSKVNSSLHHEAQFFLMAAITRVGTFSRKGQGSNALKDQGKSLPGLSHCQKNLLAKLVACGELRLRETEKLVTICLKVTQLDLVAAELGVSRQRLKSNLRDLCRTGWLPSMAWVGEDDIEVALSHTVLAFGELMACQQQLKNQEDLSAEARTATATRLRELHQEIPSILEEDAARGREEERLLALESGKEPVMREARSKLVRLAYEMAKGCYKPGRRVGELSKEVALVAAAAIGFPSALVSDHAMALEGGLQRPQVQVLLSQDDGDKRDERQGLQAVAREVAPHVRAQEAPSGQVAWEGQQEPGEATPASEESPTSIFSQLPPAVSRDRSYWHTPTGKQEIQLRNEFYSLARSINPSYGSEVARYYERNPSIADLKAKLATLQRLGRGR